MLVFLVQQNACELAGIDETGDSRTFYLMVRRMVLPDNYITEVGILKKKKKKSEKLRTVKKEHFSCPVSLCHLLNVKN